ncbi:MAG: rRNA maturation RNase YbeY [Verrucomicrobia bacterium]|nr:rRNA maturation RNase YbeY [Deltaproteobacteria bacterium]
MQILLNNRQRKHPITPRQLKKVAVRILSALECPEESELSISIVGDRSIRIINREYLSKDRPTNVISFSLLEGDYGNISPHILGDVIISAETSAREAEQGGMQHFERLCFLLMHGVLHLCGYDHERSGADEADRMEKKEKELFRILKKEGLLNPTGS